MKFLQTAGNAEQILLKDAGRHYEMIYPPGREWNTVLEVLETILK